MRQYSTPVQIHGDQHRHLHRQRRVSWLLSTIFSSWVTKIDFVTCPLCASLNGRIVDWSPELLPLSPPLHRSCRCRVIPVPVFLAGTATDEGTDGVDWSVAYDGMLPHKYITKSVANMLGLLPWQVRYSHTDSRKSIGGDVFANFSHKLPEKPGRVWYEADINANRKDRGPERLLYSNDGLLFATFDHYMTFVVIITEDKIIEETREGNQ